MTKLMRRVAAGLALPLVIGAPAVLLASPAQAAPPMVTLTPNANPSVYGQEIRVVAQASDGETNPVTSGSIQFVVEGVDQGAPVHLDANGRATSPPLFDEGGLPLDVTQFSEFYGVSAEFVPDIGSDFTEGNNLGGYAQTVNEAGSSLAVLPGPTTITADLSGQLPGGVQAGSIKPTGIVTFTVGGAPVGTAPVAANGRATLGYVVPPGGARSVAASYEGDARYTGSADAVTRLDPEITARVLARFPRSRSGWYRTPVDVVFTCRPHGSELAEDCPLEVTVRKSGKDQSVSRTVRAVDGGLATVLVGDIDIDRDDPKVSIVNGRCKATDELSGVKSCKLRRVAGGRVLLAIATDEAGNQATKRLVL